jgi:hypothetical protein
MIFNQQIGFSTFEFYWPIAVQQNTIRHQFNGLGKDHSGGETSPVILSSGPLRRIHFHFAKYSSLLIQCRVHRRSVREHRSSARVQKSSVGFRAEEGAVWLSNGVGWQVRV